MGLSKKPSQPLQSEDLFSQFQSVPDTFGTTKVKEIGRELPSFNPSEYKHLVAPSPYADRSVLQDINAASQPISEQAGHALTQFGANFASSFGQGVANTFDVSSWGNDNYQSSLFGLTTKEMQDWANGVAQRNSIDRRNAGSFDLGDSGWWAEQFASSGTSLGMGVEALLETIGIEAATGGFGTGAVLGKLGQLFEKIKGARGAVGLAETMNAVKDMRSAATVYGVMNRLNESRMEAMQSYDEIYNDMKSQKNPDGSAKYTDDQLNEFAHAGATKTYLGNLALLPLDILSYRTMVFNPISGGSEGLLEKGLEKVAGAFGKSTLGRAAGWTASKALGVLPEGAEEGFQYIAQEEGKHYAKVLGGQEDSSDFLDRFGKDVNQDEFWNNVAGGIVGAPITGGVMNLANKVITGNRTAKLNAMHDNYIQNIGKMDNKMATTIRELQAAGKDKEADIMRRQFRSLKALNALHLDAMTDKDTAFDSHVQFLQGTLDEVNAGKLDALHDLGFNNPTPEQVDYIKKNFQDSINDANEMKTIYDNVKNKYNKNFVPQITYDHFTLNNLVKGANEVNQELAVKKSKLNQFGELSPQGKQIYDMNYDIESLGHEQRRLNEEHAATEDEQEKANVNSLIESNKAKIISLKSKLNEINSDETYTKEAKEKDNDILKSALMDKEYAQLMYEKERLDNEVTLKRKNLALWNDKKYQAKKNTQSIKKASTVQQVENTAAEISKTGASNAETEEALQTKRNQLAAEEAAKVLAAEQEAAKTAEDKQVENEHIEGIKAGSAFITPTPKGGTVDSFDEKAHQEEEAFMLSPADLDLENAPQEAKDKIINGVKGLVARQQGEKSFEKLVRQIGEAQGMDTAENLFNAIKYGWEKAGFAPDDYQAVYDKVFADPMKMFTEGAQLVSIKTPAQLEVESAKSIEAQVAADQKPVGVDSEGAPVYQSVKYQKKDGSKAYVTTEASPKFAFVSRLDKLVRSFDDKGNLIVSHEYTEDQLNQGDYVDSTQLLDPDKWNEGTEAVAKIPANFMDIKIAVWNPDGSKGQAKTFGQYVAENNLSPTDQKYLDKIPMIIYRKGAASDEKGVAFVHDVDWYNANNFHFEHQSEMNEAINSTRDIRKAVADDPNKSQDLVITGKRQTTFSGLKTPEGVNISVNEGNPEAELVIALTTEDIYNSKGTTPLYPNDKTELINKSPFTVGRVYDVRRYGTKEGKETFVASPVTVPKLDDISKTSVLQAMHIYNNRRNQTPDIRSKHDAVAKQIYDTMGLDILSNAQNGGIMDYLSHFMYVHDCTNIDKSEDVESRMKGTLAYGTPYVALAGGGNLIFGKAGVPLYTYKKDGKDVTVYSQYMNPNLASPKMNALQWFKDNTLSWYEQNLSLKNNPANRMVVTIDQNLSAQSTKPYQSFMKDRYMTNIKSVNIGTQEKPNYVTNIQPVITYNLKSKVEIKAPSVEEAKAEVVPAAVTPAVEVAKKSEDLDALIKAQLDRASEELGKDFGIADGTEMPLFAPVQLTDQQRNDTARSINRIAGLTPDQQFDVVDFMYNQITSLITPDNPVITKAAAEKKIDEAFSEVIEPLRKTYNDRIEEMEAIIKQSPEALAKLTPAINSYKYRLNKIASIEASMDVLKLEANNRVVKYTGITQDKIHRDDMEDEEVQQTSDSDDTGLSQDADEDTQRAEETPNEKETDFWTDVLRENPENKITYAMRRFFGNVREYDKNGKAMTGFLGLPTYTGSDTIIRTLMVTLADVPSDFKTMIDKLEEVKKGIPWMQEVINKLNGADNEQKAQFVTVMSLTKLRMKFTMISYDKKTESWTTKVWDTHMTGVADAVRTEWINNFKDSDLTTEDADGNYTLNKTKAREMVSRFESMIGKTVPDLTTSMTALRGKVDEVKRDRPAVFEPTGELLTELQDKLQSPTDRVKFRMKTFDYQISKNAEGKYEIAFLQQGMPVDEEGKASFKDAARKWLGEFGITLTDDTFEELMTKGMLHNYKMRDPKELFYMGDNTTQSNGLFSILYLRLKALLEKPDVNFTQEGNTPLEDTVIKSLATLESKYNTVNTPFGFRENGKSYFALTAPKFFTDRARDLKSADESVRQQLASVSYSSGSMWLGLMNDPSFRDKFNVAHIGANAFKELGKKLYKDNSITKLPDTDHELTKLGMLWDTNQGEIKDSATGLSNYPGSPVTMRMGTVFSPTMSDKHIMTLLTTAVLNLRNAELNNGAGINEQVKTILYEQLVRPELKRMVKFAQLKQKGTQFNISGYEKGAGLFMMLPTLNNVQLAPGVKLKDVIAAKPNDYNVEAIEANENLMTAIKTEINNYVNELVNDKLEVWKKLGIVSVDKEGNVAGMNFIDKKYRDKNFRGTEAEIARMAAMDFVINYMVANSNSFMLFAGDPAMYYKEAKRFNEDGSIRPNTDLEKVMDSFVNVGKRLANQIAPGTPLSNSEHEKYLQVFLDDRKSLPEILFLKSVTRLIDGQEITDAEIEILKGNDKAAISAVEEKFPLSSGYFSIEGSDAQEYTTWQEHLDIMSKLGKTPDMLSEISPKDIREARELLAAGTPMNQLTKVQRELIGKVMQPIKPVYTGQIYDQEKDVMRTMYIKSSSFPLIPQLTAGMEIDKLRLAMEKLEKTKGLKVRASYQTANKVGSVTNAMKVWNNDGTINEDNLKNIEASSLLLNRKNFRIQQEVPFKSAKVGDDKITLGTQLMKLLFGDEIMNMDGFEYNGRKYVGAELHRIYNDKFGDLIKTKRDQLFDELGLDSQGNPIDQAKSVAKLQNLLKDEATKRGYPLQDIEGLQLTDKGEFNLPLWASTNSNRYESMLNSIVSNRLIRMKFPGNSFVVGSEEGFIKSKQEDLAGVDESKIIWTSAWNGTNLQASYHTNGQVHKAQVLISSKFKNKDGVLIDLFTKQNGEYKYITRDAEKKTYHLKEDMFDKDLLSMISFRIPTSGHQSASQIEIAGFLPAENADLMIVPRNFTKQKGLDFDVDKENSYMYWTHINEDGKIERLQEKHRNAIIAAADTELKKALESDPTGKFISQLFGTDDMVYTEEDIKDNKALSKLSSKIDEKLLQNDLIAINHSVMGSSNPKMFKKINQTLNTDFAEAQADFIDGLVNSNIDNKYWTPLSDEYQKQKLISGASGKIGTGAYSLDVVFHSLAQQAAITGRPIELIEVLGEGTPEEETRPKTWRFGSITSFSKLGETVTADGGRSISDVMTERQNVAVDNEKLQVMGRVNLNDITMDVDKVFNMIGLDKGRGDGNSIAMLFLSQPIIKEYVERLKNSGSTVGEYVANREQTIFDDLLKEYEGDNQVIIDDKYWKEASDNMTNDNLINAIKAGKDADKALQASVLRRFAEMRKYGLAIRNLQVTINTDSKGLGKSFFDVIEKRNALNRLGSDTKLVTGASGLIGEYEAKQGLSSTLIKERIDAGYVDIGQYLVKPDTLSGSFNIHGVSTAYNTWSKFFPYDAEVTQKAFSEVLALIGTEDMKDTRIVELKQDIFRHMKKYFAGSRNNKIMNPEDNINAERKRLYIDSDENVSLAKYLKTITSMTNNPVVNEFIKTNQLINRFEYDINKNGQPSLIKFNNAAGEEFDEQYLYESLTTLLELRGETGKVQLPEVGNKKYTLDTLAQDLINYCFLGNSTQEAIQFTKYVPIAFLNNVQYTGRMRQLGTWLKGNPNVLGVRPESNEEGKKHFVSEFTMQYIQHNPERLLGGKSKLNVKEFNKLVNMNDDGSFTFKDGRDYTFISVYDPTIPKGEKKFKLYWYDGAKYNKISVLGAFGMDEYQVGAYNGVSLVNERSKLTVEPQAAIKNEVPTTTANDFNVHTGNSSLIVETIGKSGTTFAALANLLLPYSTGVQIVVTDQHPTGATSYAGYYDRESQIIGIHPKTLADQNKLAETIMHELVHHLTVHSVRQYIDSDPAAGQARLNTPDAPMHVENLVRLYNRLKSNVNYDKLLDVANKFRTTGLTAEEKGKYYGFISIYEFMTMALTNKDFQQELAKSQDGTSGVSLLERFKEFISDVLKSLGVNFSSNSDAAQVINSIFGIIENSNQKAEDNFNPYQMFHDDSMNNDNFDEQNLGTEPEGGFSNPEDRADDKKMLAEAETALRLHFKDPAFLNAFLNNIPLALQEAAAQLNSSESEAQGARGFYGDDFSDIALKMYPKETPQARQVRDYIANLNSDQIEC